MRKHPTGIAEKYLHPQDRLSREVKRLYSKWQTQADTAVRLDDFNAYSPTHSYIFRPTGEMWAGASINARISPPTAGVKPSAWLDRHRAVEQMTWAPGLPTDIEAD